MRDVVYRQIRHSADYLLIICMKFRRVFFMTAFMTACIFVVLAEMGDKTQLLAMAFATKYNWKTVMAGVFAATVFNHLLR